MTDQELKNKYQPVADFMSRKAVGPRRRGIHREFCDTELKSSV